METSRNSGGEFAVVLLNGQGTIVDGHPSCAEAFGWSEAELAGRDIGDVLEYGRDLLMQQLSFLQDDSAEAAGNTSFSVRVMARRKDRTQYRARVTVRRFPKLDCWTAAFYRLGPGFDETATPVVRMEEIMLATNRHEQTTGLTIAQQMLLRA
jgi:PAS domain-containing protein